MASGNGQLGMAVDVTVMWTPWFWSIVGIDADVTTIGFFGSGVVARAAIPHRSLGVRLQTDTGFGRSTDE